MLDHGRSRRVASGRCKFATQLMGDQFVFPILAAP